MGLRVQHTASRGSRLSASGTNKHGQRIVTGGSRGIGRGILVELARQGADVVINYFAGADHGFARDTAADETVAEIEALGRRAIAVEGAIADPEVNRELVQTAVDAFGGVDVLASNVSGKLRPLRRPTSCLSRECARVRPAAFRRCPVPDRRG